MKKTETAETLVARLLRLSAATEAFWRDKIADGERPLGRLIHVVICEFYSPSSHSALSLTQDWTCKNLAVFEIRT